MVKSGKFCILNHYGTLTVNSPAVVKVITPSHIHINIWVLSSVGIFPSKTFGTPVTHGVVVAGIQGIGVKTPRAAAVALATTGLAILVHIPNGIILTIGI